MNFETYENYLERNKNIGVPNLALEQAERLLQVLLDPNDAPSIERLMVAVEAFGAAKFSCANDGRRDLFDQAELGLNTLRKLISELGK